VVVSSLSLSDARRTGVRLPPGSNEHPLKASEEHVAVVDEQNRPAGSATREEMRRRCLIHRASYVLVFNSRGELFLHKRTDTKDVYPGCYDVAAGGVVLRGESYEEAAEREVGEELGVQGASLCPLFDFFHEDRGNRVWGRVFSCRWDGPVTLQAEEVAWGAFVPVGRVLTLAEMEPFTPDSLIALRRYLESQS
jgi:8-oxo-dGTP pyrophosphatase MutT (NUDIX family)